MRLNFRTSAFAGALGTAAFSAGMFLGRTGFGSYVPQRHLKRLIVTAGLFGAAVSALVVPFALHADALPPGTVKPALFCQITQPEGKDYIAIPRVSGESRRYIPMGFLKAGTMVTDLLQIIPDATLFHFGILISNVHMAWMRAVCGRLKSDYRYSKDIVYNNFPWPDATDEQKARIEQTAHGILDARAKYPDSALKDLYNELTMPPDLRKAHQENDRAVMAAYGFPVKTTESECVAELFKRYQALASQV